MASWICTSLSPRAQRGIRTLPLFLLTLLLLLLPHTAGAQVVPPDAEWRTFDTDKFRVTYMVGLEPLARRAAERAERSYEVLSRELLPPPRGRIEMVVADNWDTANGTAQPFPRNRIVVFAQPPVADAALSFHEDWLELLVLHELVHIFHMEHAGGIWLPLRRVFGRDPLLFPQVYAPAWVMEGLATYLESELTRGGRVRGTIFDMILRTAILEGRFFSIDQATVEPTSWPAGNTRYVYGSLFLDHLARRFGPEAIPRFLERIGTALVPYRFDAAARQTFGVSLTDAWNSWEDSLRVEYTALAAGLRARGVTEPEILTRDGRIAAHPRFSADGRRIAYTAATGREDAAIRLLHLDGAAENVAIRTSVGSAAWMPGQDRLIYAQFDVVDQTYRISDLHNAWVGGGQRQITRGARLWDPDPHPDERRLIAVGSATGTNVLTTVDLVTGLIAPLTEPDLDRYWASPRWSPAGDRIAVTRWQTGGLVELLVTDSTGSVISQVTSDRAVDREPAWSPDGRYIVFSSDRTGIPNLFAYDTWEEGLWQVTNVLTGAFQPDVSPDGGWIVYSHYGALGYHIARIPFDPALWRPAEPPLPSLAEPVPPLAQEQRIGGESRRYSPWSTILPTRWSVALAGDQDIGLAGGVVLSGQDVVDRHVWSLRGLVFPEDGRVSGVGMYRYRGFGNPVVELRGGQEWQVQAASGTLEVPEHESLPDLLRREREIGGTLTWNRRRWLSVGWIETGADLRDVAFIWRGAPPEGAPAVRAFPLDVGSMLGGGYSTLRMYGLSLGPQEGFSTSARLQARRYLETPAGENSRRDYWRLTTRNRAFRGLDWFGFAPPVLAARLNGGIESEAATPGFTVGGSAVGTSGGGAFDGNTIFGTNPAYGVRGYSPGVQRGNRALAGSLEYRFPLVAVERGFRLFPLGLNRLWGDLFVDAGSAWCPEPCPAAVGTPLSAPDPLVSAGAEAILDLRVGYFVNLPLRLGVGVPLREPGAFAPQVYLRVGAEF